MLIWALNSNNTKILFFVLLFLLRTLLFPVSLQPKIASITPKGSSVHISIDNNKNIILKKSALISIDSLMNAYTTDSFSYTTCKQYIIAIDTITGATDTCKISIVPWVVNKSILKTEVIDSYKIIGKSDDSLRLVFKNGLYKMKDDFKKMTLLSDFTLNTDFFSYIKTPLASFIRDGFNIYKSYDEKEWSIDFKTTGRGIYNSFSYETDSKTKKTYIFAPEYQNFAGQDTFKHCVFRKIIDSAKNESNWGKSIEFPSQDEWFTKDRSMINACRHIHTVSIDPYTNQIWIGTGDDDRHCQIYYSADNGDTWHKVGWGSQEWRVLSIWFTKNFVYWSTDTKQLPQSIFRVPKEIFLRKNSWPSFTERLDSGVTKVGFKYFIQKSNLSKFKVGDLWIATYAQKLDSNLIVYSINDLALDYREKVKDLSNSALWSNLWVTDTKGDSVLLLTTDAEGKAIDDKVRIFGIKERINKTTDIQELLSDVSNNIYSQFQLYNQSSNGKIYMKSMNTKFNLYNNLTTTLIWNDNTSSQGGVAKITRRMSDSTTMVIKLNNYKGKIINWQIADKTFYWKNIKTTDNQHNDSLITQKEAGKIKYIRAIVQDSMSNPSASTYVKIDSVMTNKDNNLLTEVLNKKLFTCYPVPTFGTLNIKCNVDNISNAILEIQTITGITILSRNINFSEIKIIKQPVENIEKGIYFLRLKGKFKIYSQKFIVM
ncbi:MAG: T9SS type A sorting domain-containing protein [Bacteroidales bacterium]|nr:T9SS type A sorting domain-containing protein [Bacteroidales bacterium]